MKRSEIVNKISELQTQLKNTDLSKNEVAGLQKSLSKFEERLAKLNAKKEKPKVQPTNVSCIGTSKKGGKLWRVQDSSKSLSVMDIIQKNPSLFNPKTKKITLVLKKELTVPETFDINKDDIASLWNNSPGDVFSYLEQSKMTNLKLNINK